MVGGCFSEKEDEWRNSHGTGRSFADDEYQ